MNSLIKIAVILAFGAVASGNCIGPSKIETSGHLKVRGQTA